VKEEKYICNTNLLQTQLSSTVETTPPGCGEGERGGGVTERPPSMGGLLGGVRLKEEGLGGLVGGPADRRRGGIHHHPRHRATQQAPESIFPHNTLQRVHKSPVSGLPAPSRARVNPKHRRRPRHRRPSQGINHLPSGKGMVRVGVVVAVAVVVAGRGGWRGC